jgi:vacuolar-type H+-ATPase subunit C/Vma6
MFSNRGMMLPLTREELEANEDAWLESGESDQYGACSFFIHKHYTDDEKQALFSERATNRAITGGQI